MEKLVYWNAACQETLNSIRERKYAINTVQYVGTDTSITHMMSCCESNVACALIYWTLK